MSDKILDEKISLKAMASASFGDFVPMVKEVGEKFRVEIEVLDRELHRAKSRAAKYQKALEIIALSDYTAEECQAAANNALASVK